jgi:hypothetical protein
VPALEDTNDAALGPRLTILIEVEALDANNDAVAVHCVDKMRWRDMMSPRFERTLGGNEPIASRVSLQAADVEIHLLGQTKRFPRI